MQCCLELLSGWYNTTSSTKCTNVLPQLGYHYLTETLYVFWAYHEKETEKRMAKNESLVYRELTLLVGRKYETKKMGKKLET